MERSRSHIDSFRWVFATLRKPFCGTFIWNMASTLTILTVGVFSKLLIEVFNITHYYNRETLDLVLDTKPEGVPLITLSNHHSVFDDPGFWGMLKLPVLCNRKMRWALAAHDVCFTNRLYSYFFMLGKCVPLVRGEGIHQEAMDFCLERLKEGEWVHIFPEGKVNMRKEHIRFKWGVGRLIYESPVTPVVLPFWHLGMDEIVPNEPPYIFRIGKLLTINVGNPIDFSDLVEELRIGKASAKFARRIITERVEAELMFLKEETERLHALHQKLE